MSSTVGIAFSRTFSSQTVAVSKISQLNEDISAVRRSWEEFLGSKYIINGRSVDWRRFGQDILDQNFCR